MSSKQFRVLLVKPIFLALVLLMASVNFSSAASMIKGSVPSKGNKFYHFSSFNNGHITVTCIYDNAGADINIGAGVGDTLVAASIGSQKQFEQLKTGTLSGVRWTILLQNYSGPSTSFRLVVEGAEAEDVLTGASLSTDVEKLMKKLRALPDLILKAGVR